MSDRSFIDSWSLNFDDIAFIEGFNLVSGSGSPSSFGFFRTHGRFSPREDNPRPERLRYPDPGRFCFHHVNARRHRAAILRHLGVRRFVPGLSRTDVARAARSRTRSRPDTRDVWHDQSRRHRKICNQNYVKGAERPRRA